ncbi:MAG: polyphosphate kinase 1 [Flavobacteriaceae bacterium]
MKENQFINRELSWLDFNARVLQEAADPSVPLIERLRFLGIFSNNLDEFFQVRFATVKRIAQSQKTGKKALGGIKADELLKDITKVVIKQQADSAKILLEIENQLEKENIHFLREEEVNATQAEFLRDYFLQKISPRLVTVILKEEEQDFTDNKAFLAIKMELTPTENITKGEKLYAVIEMPKEVDRFVVLPPEGEKQNIMMLDDLIRYHFHLIFSMFNYDRIEGHMIKITRDAELDIEEDVGKSYVEKIIDSVKDRLIGDPVRLVHDKTIAPETLAVVMRKLGVASTDSLIPGGRYHHRRDYMNFPSLNRKDLLYSPFPALPLNEVSLEENILEAVAKKDYMIYTPYQNFAYVIKFLREAALDPQVKTIKITIYRLAKLSQVASSLINAAKNGKKVLVQIELQARFDEENNIQAAESLEKAGVQLIFGVPGLKVHTKICVIERLEGKKLKRYGFISTGNFNESTARIYTDYTLFTSHQKILKDVLKVFNFLSVNYKIKKYKHLIVSPHYTFSALIRLIEQEIAHKEQGKKARIRLKLNNITNYKIISKLYEASRAGVQIDMIVRGVCCLIPGVKGMSENIRVISVVDKFLEHPRVYIFENDGDPQMYISSADWMTRNIDNRVEVACPILDKDLQQELLDTFMISWNDNVKARLVNTKNQNAFVSNQAEEIRSQWATYAYYKEKLNQ